MPDVLIYADTIRSPELRHELPLGIPDPFLYVERNGQRHVVLTSFEIARVLEIAGAPEPHAYEEFGYDDLIAKGLPRDEVLLEVAVNACGALGVTEALVPWTFPTKFADRLRAAGVELTPELDFFQDRRRVKSKAELAGIRRAQRAAEAGMDAARSFVAARRAQRRRSGRGRASRSRPSGSSARSWRRSLRAGRSPTSSSSRTAPRAQSGTTWGPGRSPRASRW